MPPHRRTVVSLNTVLAPDRHPSSDLAAPPRVLALASGCAAELVGRGVRLANYTVSGKALLIATDRHGDAGARWTLVEPDADLRTVATIVTDLRRRLDEDDPPALGIVR